MIPSVALVLGAGFAVAGGLPATGGLMDGKVRLVSRQQEQRVGEVLASWDTWRRRHGDDAAAFLGAAYRGEVPTANEQVLPGSALPWLWVAQYLAVRVSEHTTGTRAGSSPRHFERLTTPSDVRSHRQLLSEVCSRGRLAGVVTSNYDLLAERVLRHRRVRGRPTPGCHYGGLPGPQIAFGSATPWRQRDGSRNETITLTGALPLCKLHGSLNWERQGLPGVQDEGPVKLWQDLRRSYRLDAPPAIVAPIPETEPPVWLALVWRAAARTLENADEWIVVGYSLPDYDVAIRGLLSRAAHRQRVVVRDHLAADILPRYAALLPDCEVTAGSPL